jgi:hypothetical protein
MSPDVAEAVASIVAVPANVEPLEVVQVTVGSPTASTTGELNTTAELIATDSATNNLIIRLKSFVRITNTFPRHLQPHLASYPT